MNKPIKCWIDTSTDDGDIKGVNSPNITLEDNLEAMAEYLNAVFPPVAGVEEPCLIDGVPSVGYVYTWSSPTEVENARPITEEILENE